LVQLNLDRAIGCLEAENEGKRTASRSRTSSWVLELKNEGSEVDLAFAKALQSSEVRSSLRRREREKQKCTCEIDQDTRDVGSVRWVTSRPIVHFRCLFSFHALLDGSEKHVDRRL